MLPRIRVSRMVKRKSTDQFGLELTCQFTGFFHISLQIFSEWDVAIGTPVVDIQQFHLADRRPQRRDLQAIFVLQFLDRPDLGFRQLHDVFDSIARVDETNRVILQAECCKGCELLDGRLLIGGFVS